MNFSLVLVTNVNFSLNFNFDKNDWIVVSVLVRAVNFRYSFRLVGENCQIFVVVIG